MNTVERIRKICKDRHISIAKLERECGFGNGYISNLRRDVLPYDRLVAVAKYLHVSPEYLSRGEEITLASNEGGELTEQQKELIDLIRNATPEEISVLLAAAKAQLKFRRSPGVQ